MSWDRISLRCPDDWHLHLRDGLVLPAVLAQTVRSFKRAIVMPNLVPAVTTVESARAYRDRIIAALPPLSDFVPLMTLYLTEDTVPLEITNAHMSGFIYGVKWYPAGVTTNAHAGVRDVSRCYDTLAKMEELGVVLQVHGEVTDSAIDIFDREAVFIDRYLVPLMARFPMLRIVLEHITTENAVAFVQSAGVSIAATITPHHLLWNRNALFQGGLRPHMYCLPVLKRERHREALVAAATSGNKRFFLGTDSAPHSRQTKEAACGCAGIYGAPVALETYAEVFDEAHALDRLEGFASDYGADFYGLARNIGTVTLVKEPWSVPAEMPCGDTVIVPMRAGETIAWRLLSR